MSALPAMFWLLSLLGAPDSGADSPASNRICLAFVGDLMHHCTQSTGAGDGKGGYDFRPSFSRISRLIQAGDLAVGNLETPTDGRLEDHCFPRFSAPSEYLDAIAEAGFDVLTLANNHGLDRGPDGLARTLARVRERGMTPVGVVPGVESATLEVKGVRVTFLARTTLSNLRCRDLPCPAIMKQPEDRSALVEQVRVAAARGDLVVVLLHWMSEDRVMPDSRERAFAQTLIQAGAAAVVGSHPHVLGPGEAVRVKTGAGLERLGHVRYSLGNFIHGMKRFPVKLGAVELVCFVAGAEGFTVDGVETTHTFIFRNEPSGRDRAFQALPLEEAEELCRTRESGRHSPSSAECLEVKRYRKWLGDHPGL